MLSRFSLKSPVLRCSWLKCQIVINFSSGSHFLQTRWENLAASNETRIISGSSLPEVFCKKCVLRNFAKFTGKHLCQSLFFNKVAGLTPATLLKKRLWHRCFPVNFAKFLETPFIIEHLWWLLLYKLLSATIFIMSSRFLPKGAQMVLAQAKEAPGTSLRINRVCNY